jgi:quinoprotein relay system zinc metallohydrolase 2
MTDHASFMWLPGTLVKTVRLYALALVVIMSGVVAPHLATANEVIPFPVKEVASGVFVYEAPIALADEGNLGAIANLGFIIGRDGVAVIDSGGSAAAGRRLLKAIRQRTNQPIRYVINTHMHPDHVLGNAAFDGSGVTLVGHRNLPRSLAEREKVYLTANGALIGNSFKGTQVIPPSLLVDHVVELDLGDRRLRVEAWRTAHTNTDVTVLDLATDTWFLGDLLFIGHVPALDGSLAGWVRILGELRSRPAARVVPGHGPISVPWPSAAAPMEQYLTRLEADIRLSIHQGRTISEATQRAAQSEAGAWMLFNEFNPRNATTAFHELEWE